MAKQGWAAAGMPPQAGRTILVTGANSGVGFQAARELARHGAQVLMGVRDIAKGETARNRILAELPQAQVAIVPLDMASLASIRGFAGDFVASGAKLDVLVNNAGIYEFSPIENVTEEHFHKQFNTNVLGLIFASKAAANQFGPEGGSIINISSVVSTFAPPTSAVYSATKGAVDTATKVLANELGPRKIRVNSINPGMVETEGVHTAGFAEGEFRAQIEAQTPLGRIGQVEDIAPAAVFFASPDSAWITGQSLVISGGLS